MNQRQQQSYIDLAEIFTHLLQRIGVIILCGLIGGAAGFCYSAFIATPLYSADALMIVNSSDKHNDSVTTDELNSAATLVETYGIIIKSDTVMDEVYRSLKMEDTYKDTVRNIDVSSVNNTQVMQISVTATDPDIALDVCREITTVAPDVIVDAVEAGSVKVVQKASTTYEQVSPNVGRNTVVAALIGILLAVGVITVQTISDNKVSNERDIDQLDLTLLGVIPSYDEGEK